MALATNTTLIPSSSVYCVARFGSRDLNLPFSGSHGDVGDSVFCVGSHAGKSDVVLERRRLKPVNTRIVENNNSHIKSTFEITVSCYQLIGVPDRVEKDEIVKAVMSLKNAEIEEGYTMDVVTSRQDLLMDVRDKLLFEPEYAGDLREKIPPKSSLRIPWSWLPGALCLLQEVGESKLVLDIGRASLQHQGAKPYADDLLLAMALAECAIAKIGFEKKKVSQGFEALARAQCILRSKPSLAKMTLLSQIEESLEELAPACTLELLSMAHTPENVDRRRGAIAALCELIRQGLGVEASCQVQDWPSFLSQAFDNLLANEIVDLLPWDNLAEMRRNKKTIESQNLRVVVDANCFYKVFTAHMALGFSSKQKELINKAKSICECLIASEGIDLKFEEAFCLFLLGQGTEADVVEKLKQLELNLNPKHNSVLGKAIIDASAANPSLEMWLKDSVLALFPDTKACSPALANFFSVQKKFSGSKKTRGPAQTLPSICHRPLSSSGSLDRRDTEEPRSYMSSSPNIGFAVKQLAPTDLQSSLLSGSNEKVNNLSESPVQVKRSLGTQRSGIWDSHFTHAYILGKITYISVLGCIVFATIKLMGINFSRLLNGSPGALNDNIAWTVDSSADYSVSPAYIRGGNIADRLKKILPIAKIPFLHKSAAGKHHDLHASLTPPSSPTNAYRRLMPVVEAETLVKQWQTIKAEALGSSHEVNCLAEVLDESMLAQWQALADVAKEKSCHWRFLLLKLSVLRADILLDVNGVDIAEIEALLEEAAELVDNSQKKNPNYYSTYKVKYILKRQGDGSWKFCEGDIRTP
ncbi:PREDICTED: plastid division protein CDP1, chloroplastic-like [Lupinus angustifolius]|uniref:plastid division protein CDP1, chloroplastic-like n=1 Tax=Lupinus angustifolius TaxID=3871 RepID=UPI00092E2598|nr:PREDICTED: plastid division protein CDP1, chloroplastic-like [Lupinus angustifolius]